MASGLLDDGGVPSLIVTLMLVFITAFVVIVFIGASESPSAGLTYKVLSKEPCDEESFCFILVDEKEKDGATELLYKTERTDQNKTIEAGDSVFYTVDKKLKILEKEVIVSPEKVPAIIMPQTKVPLLQENIIFCNCE